jgi:hypothetical protein
MLYYSAINKSAIMSFAGKWREVDIAVSSKKKKSQTKKDKYCMFFSFV